MEYISIHQAAEKWGISSRQAQKLCKNGQVNGAVRFSGAWAIPARAPKPPDGRYKTTGSEQNPSQTLLQYSPEKAEVLSQAVEKSPFAIALFSPNGTLTYANDEFFRYFLVANRDDVLGKMNLLQDDITRTTELTEIASRALAGETVSVSDKNIPLQSLADSYGTQQPLFKIRYGGFTSYPILDADGKLTYMATIFMTEREYEGRQELVRCTAYIDRHWQEPFHLESLIKEAGLSKSQLFLLFKQSTATGPRDYYRMVKINHLKEFLRDENLSISQAFSACGIDYSGYHAKVFKEVVGQTPLEYRKSHL